MDCSEHRQHFLWMESLRTAHIPKEDTDGRVGRSSSCLANLRYPKSLCGPMEIFKVHLIPKFSFGRDETVQHLHKQFDNFISIWYF